MCKTKPFQRLLWDAITTLWSGGTARAALWPVALLSSLSYSRKGMPWNNQGSLPTLVHWNTAVTESQTWKGLWAGNKSSLTLCHSWHAFITCTWRPLGPLFLILSTLYHILYKVPPLSLALGLAQISIPLCNCFLCPWRLNISPALFFGLHTGSAHRSRFLGYFSFWFYCGLCPTTPCSSWKTEVQTRQYSEALPVWSREEKSLHRPCRGDSYL